MSFGSMSKSLAQGEIPGVSLAFVKTTINESLKRVYTETDWSFQTEQSGWYVPALINAGTVTCTPYSNQVIADAAATAAWALVTGRPTLTERQFRNPSWALYNIVAYDTTTNAPFATLTLDRPWMEVVTGPGLPYMIYQAYFPVPVQDFTKFIEIRDTTNSAPVSFTYFSQDDLAAIDPKRLMFGPTVPTYAVPWGVDKRAGSSTLGYIMYELWPHVLALYPYSFSYKRSGPLLVDQGDELVYPISEELVKWRAKEVLYQWKEAQKGEQVERGAGANWQFLAQGAAAEYKEELKKVRMLDANLHRDFVTRPRNPGSFATDGYSTNRTGDLNVGTFRR
jgi:hypothetical protein